MLVGNGMRVVSMIFVYIIDSESVQLAGQSSNGFYRVPLCPSSV
jgi:hypothetical protein